MPRPSAGELPDGRIDDLGAYAGLLLSGCDLSDQIAEDVTFERMIFKQVALSRTLISSIQQILDPTAPPLEPERATHAIFFSISNCQPGLRGVSFGNFLIKQVVVELQRELPELKTFATLSPIPSFRNWLKSALEGASPPELEAGERTALAAAGRLAGVLGDGVTDVPALKAARLAIAQGPGTQMARTVADVVLVRGEFAAVPAMVAEGLSNQAVADRLFLSPQTVKVHVRNIYSKLDVRSRTQAVARARVLGILSTE